MTLMDPIEVLNRILSVACGNPVDWPDYSQWTEAATPDSDPYPGWMKYDIELCCQKVQVVARGLKDVKSEGEYIYTQYEVKELIWE